MRKALLTIWLLLAGFLSRSQVIFETSVSPMPVVAGGSFQIQYIVEEGSKDDDFFPPDFKEFRFISGPHISRGSASNKDGFKKLKNIGFTLEAIKPGKFIIPGAVATVNGLQLKSENVLLEVISSEEAIKLRLDMPLSNSEYFLRPGEDPYKKINANLYVKVQVDKKTCFVGEPVVATFKLYSRLDSRSDIVKNPGFYGFTVQDMIGLEDKVVAEESINGKKFDVHTVRKVQLYPLQAGSFVIDAMEVMNKVKFSRSMVSRRTEQEIYEGVYKREEEPKKENIEEYETSMHTPSVVITVKPVPVKTQPADYNGATGNFSIRASLDNARPAKNEEAELIVIISGKGNFTQMAAPLIEWPAGIEGFEPVVKDSLDNHYSPMKGTRSFRYRFVSAKPGVYVLPAVHFSFFDPDSNRFKTISTLASSVTVDNKSRHSEIKPVEEKRSNSKTLTVNPAMVWLIVIVSLVIFSAWWTWRKETQRTRKMAVQPVEKSVDWETAETILQPAVILQGADDKTFYTSLRSCIWKFLAERFSLTGSGMNKHVLLTVMDQKKIAPQLRSDLKQILEQCETGIFTDADTAADKKELLRNTKELLDQIAQQQA